VDYELKRPLAEASPSVRTSLQHTRVLASSGIPHHRSTVSLLQCKQMFHQIATFSSVFVHSIIIGAANLRYCCGKTCNRIFHSYSISRHSASVVNGFRAPLASLPNLSVHGVEWLCNQVDSEVKHSFIVFHCLVAKTRSAKYVVVRE
jgi:hypothetical protein